MKQELMSKGYSVYTDIFNQEEVASIREKMMKIFSEPNPYEQFEKKNRTINKVSRLDIFNSYQGDLSWVLFNQKTISSLKDALGNDLVLLPQMGGYLNSNPGLHKDTTRQEDEGYTFHKKRDYAVYNCGFYFQINSETKGGGLSVISGSHLDKVDPYSRKSRNKFGSKVKNKLASMGVLNSRETKAKPIMNRAGDLIVFDQRIDHMATAYNMQEGKSTDAKLAIFFMCAKNMEAAQEYYDYMMSRPEYRYLKDMNFSQDFSSKLLEFQIGLIK